MGWRRGGGLVSGRRHGSVRVVPLHTLLAGAKIVRSMTLRVMRAHVLIAEAGRITRERGAERHQLHAEEGEQKDEAMDADAGSHDESV